MFCPLKSLIPIPKISLWLFFLFEFDDLVLKKQGILAFYLFNKLSILENRVGSLGDEMWDCYASQHLSGLKLLFVMTNVSS